ncbi:hypothetical protein D3C81_1869110 [compost metagenome]
MPKPELDPVPRPLPAALTALGLQPGRQVGRFATDHPFHRQPIGNGPGATGVIGMGMADQHQVKLLHPQFA